MSAIRAIDVVFLVALLLITVRLVPSAWNVLRIYTGTRKRRLEDATSFAPPAPEPVTRVIERLTHLGFERIGVRSTVLPGNERRFEWNLVDAPSTTYVALVPSPVMAGGVFMVCYSAFADGAFVSTSFPRGSRVIRTDLDTAAAGASPEACVGAHYERLAAFRLGHGAPLTNRSMADLLVRDDTYRRRHGGATFRTRVYGYVAVTAMVVVASSVQLLRVLFLDR